MLHVYYFYQKKKTYLKQGLLLLLPDPQLTVDYDMSKL